MRPGDDIFEKSRIVKRKEDEKKTDTWHGSCLPGVSSGGPRPGGDLCLLGV